MNCPHCGMSTMACGSESHLRWDDDLREFVRKGKIRRSPACHRIAEQNRIIAHHEATIANHSAEAKALVQMVEAERDEARERVRVLEEAINAKDEALEQIAETAHHASTGPAIEDAYWEIRREAYNAFALAGGKGAG